MIYCKCLLDTAVMPEDFNADNDVVVTAETALFVVVLIDQPRPVQTNT